MGGSATYAPADHDRTRQQSEQSGKNRALRHRCNKRPPFARLMIESSNAPRVSETSDEDLMQAVRDGDVARLAILFERHHRHVHALCYRLTRRADVADDLAQETMLRVLRYASSYRRDAAFATWLYRLAYNVCQDHWRKSRHDQRTTDLSEVQVVSAEGADAPIDERHALLEEAMQRLAPEHRAVLVLSRYNDLGYDEIARVLACTPGAARVRAHRALNELREIYGDLERRQRSVR